MTAIINFSNKKVILNEINNKIIECLMKALKDNGIEKNDLTKDETTIRSGICMQALHLFEQLINVKVGAKEQNLEDIKNLCLEPEAQALYEAYLDKINHLALKENVSPLDTEKDEIENPYVLVREILLRLFALALCSDNYLYRDGDKIVNVFIKFVDLIMHKQLLNHWGLINNNLSHFEKAFATTHIQWIIFLREMVHVIKLINSNTSVISETLMNLNDLKEMIHRHLISLFNINNLDKTIRGSLCQGWVNTSFNDCQKNIINRYKGNNFKMSLEIQNRIVNFDDYENNKKVRNQICSIVKNNKSKDADKIQSLYNLLDKNEIIILILQNVKGLIRVAGWIPIMMGVLNLRNISKLLKEHMDNSFKELTIIENSILLDSSIGKELVRYQHMIVRLHENIFGNSDSLIKLQDPELMKTLKVMIKTHIYELQRFEGITGLSLVMMPSSPDNYLFNIIKSEDAIDKITEEETLDTRDLALLSKEFARFGYFDRAMIYMDEIIDKLGNKSESYRIDRALLLCKLKCWDKALKDVEFVLAENPNHEQAKAMHVKLLIILGVSLPNNVMKQRP